MTIVNYRMKAVYYCVLAFLLLATSGVAIYFKRELLPMFLLTIGFVCLLYVKYGYVLVALNLTKTICIDDSLLCFKRYTKNMFSFVQNGETVELPYKHFETHEEDYILYDVKTNRLIVPSSLKYTLLYF